MRISSFWRWSSSSLLASGEEFITTAFEGGEDMPNPKSALWHKDYFELIATEKQSQVELWALSLSTSQRDIHL